MSRAFYVDTARMSEQSRRVRVLLKRREQKFREELRKRFAWAAEMAAHTLVVLTFPNGYGFALARDAMVFDVSRVYASAGKVYEAIEKSDGKGLAGAFYRAFAQRDYSKATELLSKSTCVFRGLRCGPLDPKLHDLARSSKTGRVTISRESQVVSIDDLRAYAQTAIRRLGKTAAGWSACAELLGGNGNYIPWKGTALHGSDGGEVIFEEDSDGMRYRLANLRPLARKHTHPEAIKSALREAIEELEMSLTYMGLKKN